MSIFNTWFTYLRDSFSHDHIKRKSLKGTFSFYLFGLFKWIHVSLYRYWKFIIWLTIANYCFIYFSRIGDYVLNWSNTSFPCFMNFKAYNNICMLQYVVSYDGWLSKMSVLMLQYYEVKWMTARCHGIHVWLCIMSRDGLQDLCAYDAILCLEMNEMSDCNILVLMTQYCVSRWVTARSRYWQYWWTSYLIKKIFQHMQW